MPEHACHHALDIGAMKTTLKKVDIAVNGNGKDGLTIKVDRLEHSFTEMQEDLATIARSTSAFAQSQIEQDAIEKQKNKVSEYRAKAFQRVGTVAAIVFGTVGMVYIILDHIGG